METKEIILIICTLITVISSVMWEVNNGPAKIMRAIHLGIGLVMSVCCLGILKGMEHPIQLLLNISMVCSGLISLMLLMSKGQSFFAIVIRLAHFVNLIGVVMYLGS